MSQVVANPDGMIQHIPYLVRNPRQPLPSSSGDLRHLTASAEELHPLIFSGDFKKLMTSGEVRQISYSGTDLRLVPGTGTWPLGSSSGEIRLPLQSTGTVRSITTEELRLLPSVSRSSVWGLQSTPIFSRLSPVRHQLPLNEGAQIPFHTPMTQPQSHSPSSDSQSRSSSTQPLLQAIFTEPQPQSRCHVSKPHLHVDHKPQEPSAIPYHTFSPETQPARMSVSVESQLEFVDPHFLGDGSGIPRQACPEPPTSTRHHITPTQPVDFEELQVSLTELQPPPPPSGEVKTLIDIIDIQPPPSFRESEQFPLSEDESVKVTTRKRNSAEQPVAFSLPPSLSQHPQLKSTAETCAELSSNIFQMKPSLCPALDEILEQSQDRFLPQSLKQEQSTSNINQQQSSEREEGRFQVMTRRDSKRSGKHVKFISGGDKSVPVVSSVPPKTSSERSGKRSSQMFSRVDQNPSSRPLQLSDSMVPSAKTQRPPVISPGQEDERHSMLSTS